MDNLRKMAERGLYSENVDIIKNIKKFDEKYWGYMKKLRIFNLYMRLERTTHGFNKLGVDKYYVNPFKFIKDRIVEKIYKMKFKRLATLFHYRENSITTYIQNILNIRYSAEPWFKDVVNFCILYVPKSITLLTSPDRSSMKKMMHNKSSNFISSDPEYDTEMCIKTIIKFKNGSELTDEIKNDSIIAVECILLELYDQILSTKEKLSFDSSFYTDVEVFDDDFGIYKKVRGCYEVEHGFWKPNAYNKFCLNERVSENKIFKLYQDEVRNTIMSDRKYNGSENFLINDRILRKIKW